MHTHLLQCEAVKQGQGTCEIELAKILLQKQKKGLESENKTLNYRNSDTGQTRHFTPAAQEWSSSVYTYNNMYIKSLPIADKTLFNLLKGYFNLRINDNTKYISNRHRRVSLNKIFVGKGELKHTSNKVIITFYVYNVEGKHIFFRTKKLFKSLYYPNYSLRAYIHKNVYGKYSLDYNRPFTFSEFRNKKYHFEKYLSYVIKLVTWFIKFLQKINKFYTTLTKLVDKNLLTNDEKLTYFKNKVRSFYNFTYKPLDFITFMNKRQQLYKANLIRHFYLLIFNKAKFNYLFYKKLIPMVNSIYNKRVVFNIVDLKKIHLNSDILTQAISLKLKNRDNTVYRVLNSVLSRIKLPRERKVGKPDVKGLLVNKIRNSNITSKNTGDYLNNLLLAYYASGILENDISSGADTTQRSRSKPYIEKIVMSLKHMQTRGVRLEAKGRLTRRFTASRSIYKMRWVGGLKNVDSGLSTIVLRGHVKSNVQYSIIHSKNRIGAFGIKGWVGNK